MNFKVTCNEFFFCYTWTLNYSSIGEIILEIQRFEFVGTSNSRQDKFKWTLYKVNAPVCDHVRY